MVPLTSPSMRPASEQLEILTRGTEVILPEGELLQRLQEGRPLRVKLGVDPTAPDVTLGWAVVFDLLRRFQECGHIAVLILGDFTAQVGDPTDKNATRQRLDESAVSAYAESCLPTIKRLLLPENLEIRPNSEWLSALDMRDVLELMSKFTVSRIMDRDDFTKRWEANQSISLIEFMYPLLQGRDSVAVNADIELGGTDQLFNNLVGRDLQERSGQRGQMVITVPLLVGTDGEKKMSQSLDNYISVSDPPDQMFGKTMSIPDDLMPQWYALTIFADDEEVSALRAGLADGSIHPGDAKRDLARRIVARYWGSEAGPEAEAAFDRVFRNKQAPEEVPEFPLPDDDEIWLPGLLSSAGLVASNSEGRRMVAQGAVKLDGVKVAVESVARGELVDGVLQVGKRRFGRFVAS
ncbi:MAG: tyrosine--tRNA ligase [Acidimicrobiia bacterium]|nr:tyrosine--tRNA ligase [Acidimicrobiia bacterium]